MMLTYPFKLGRGGHRIVCLRTGQQYITMETYLQSGGKLTVGDIYHLVRMMAAQLYTYHTDGRVCDQLALTQLLWPVDKQVCM